MYRDSIEDEEGDKALRWLQTVTGAVTDDDTEVLLQT